jgi:hypothetical protein
LSAHTLLSGVHDPTHTPFEQALLLQETGVPQTPLSLQVVNLNLSSHLTAPGEHEPVHAF